MTIKWKAKTGVRYPVHESVTDLRVMHLCEIHNTTLENPGVCLACGEDADDCEPDAEHYTCESCEEHAVFGADQILLSGYYHITPGGDDEAQEAPSAA